MTGKKATKKASKSNKDFVYDDNKDFYFNENKKAKVGVMMVDYLRNSLAHLNWEPVTSQSSNAQDLVFAVLYGSLPPAKPFTDLIGPENRERPFHRSENRAIIWGPEAMVTY